MIDCSRGSVSSRQQVNSNQLIEVLCGDETRVSRHLIFSRYNSPLSQPTSLRSKGSLSDIPQRKLLVSCTDPLACLYLLRASSVIGLEWVMQVVN